VRTRTIELRFTAAVLTALWGLGALYILLGYRPGGPIDIVVGLVAVAPTAVAAAAIAWPPLVRGDRTYVGVMTLGIGAILLLIPSTGSVLNQLINGGAQTLLPSIEVAYPWLLALLATSAFTGLGIARRTLGDRSSRSARLVRGIGLGVAATVIIGSTFTGVAVANDLALRDRPAASSPFGPTDPNRQPPGCSDPIQVGTTALLAVQMTANIDGHPIGQIQLSGERSGNDLRWTADVATDHALGRFGVARIGSQAWLQAPGGAWQTASTAQVSADGIDSRVLAAALTNDLRTTAENRGLEFIEGAQARHCRIEIDGPTFVAAFPQVSWFVGSDPLSHWRGELDFWIFSDGEIGQVQGLVSGEAAPLGRSGIVGTIAVALDATERDRARIIVTPTG
jgi:hypothetical protein